MSDPGPQGYVKPETRGGKVELHGRLYRQMMKPIVFGNRQKQFNIFTAIVSAAVTYYLVFQHDFGPKRHVFTWAREVKERKKREFFRIDPSDSELQRARERANVGQSRTMPADKQEDGIASRKESR